MYAISGITGRVGGTAAQILLNAGKTLRAIARDAEKAKPFTDQGADLALADALDVPALTQAYAGAEGLFVMVPPNFAPEPDFPETRAILAAMREAILAARPAKVVALSSVGAHRDHGLGLITQCRLLEQALSDLPMPVAFVRAAWFMENAMWDIEPARENGQFESYLTPLDQPIPMVSVTDIGRTVAETLLTDWQGTQVIELAGPHPYSPNDLAEALAFNLGHPVKPLDVPREEWTARFEASGMPPGRTAPREEMVDGFNSGWITFEGTPIQGRKTLESAIADLL